MDPPRPALPLRAALLLLLLSWGAYLAWLLAPEGAPLLRLLPARQWGLVPPALLVWLVCTYGATYGALALAVNPPLCALGALWDAHARRPAAAGAAGARGGQAQRVQAAAGQQLGMPLIPALGDLPITLVNRAQLEGLARARA